MKGPKKKLLRRKVRLCNLRNLSCKMIRGMLRSWCKKRDRRSWRGKLATYPLYSFESNNSKALKKRNMICIRIKNKKLKRSKSNWVNSVRRNGLILKLTNKQKGYEVKELRGRWRSRSCMSGSISSRRKINLKTNLKKGPSEKNNWYTNLKQRRKSWKSWRNGWF